MAQPTMKWTLLFCLLVASAVSAAPHELAPGLPGRPLRVSLEEPLPGKLVRGRLLPFHLVVRNISKEPAEAVVLRAVWWTGDRPDERSWLRPVLGKVLEQPDGSLSLDRGVEAPSDILFESAVLFPGDSIAVDMPLTIQRGGRQKVEMTYAEIPEERWGSDIWLPGADFSSSDRFASLAHPPGPAPRGGLAVVRASMRPNPTPLVLAHETWSVDLPLRPDVHGVTTGGLSWDGALARLGWEGWVRRHPSGYRGYWRDGMKSWLFVRDDGVGAALRRDGGGWVHEKLPRMAATLPAMLESGKDAATPMLLRADVFGSLLPVRGPAQGRWYDAGVTPVPADRLWDVLRRARDRGIELRVVTWDGNGLGNEQAVSAGIRIDARGRWLNPEPEKKY
jgi:hypothetical protein